MAQLSETTDVLDPPAASTADDDERAAHATETAQIESEEPAARDDRPADKGGRQLAVSVRGLVLGVAIAVLAVGVGAFAWLYHGAADKLEAQTRQSQDGVHAEQVALGYATNAAAMNYQDLSGWKDKLVAGTSPELKAKLGKAADQMQQILVPLQWNSTATPLAAKVRSSSAGVYVVDSFVSVLTKTAQSDQPLQSTATYSITIDSNKSWQITDVGGIGAAVQGR